MCVTAAVALAACGAHAAESSGASRSDDTATAGSQRQDDCELSARSATTVSQAEASDFNGDGYADLAIPAPLSTVDGTALAGAISVVYGSPDGPDTANAQVISRASDGELGQLAGQGLRLGDRALARDLDADGHTDLVATVTDDEGVSHVLLLWGSADGLAGGTTLPASEGPHGGDFDGDGNADLLLEEHDGEAVTVLYGPFSRDGEASRTDTLGTDFYGSFGRGGEVNEVIVGDATGDGRDDVVTSRSFEEMQDPGALHVSGPNGLRVVEPCLLDAYSANGIVADVTGDAVGDVVVRDVGEVSEYSQFEPGEVVVLPGATDAVPGPADTITPKAAGLPRETGEEAVDDVNGDGVIDEADQRDRGDEFGAALAARDVDGDGAADLVIGMPGRNTPDGPTDTGAVVLLPGGADGVDRERAVVIEQDTPGVPDESELVDRFGSAVWLGDMNGDGHPELAVGAPGESDGEAAQPTGAVWIFEGTADGPATDAVIAFGPAELGAPATGSDGSVVQTRGTGFGGGFVDPAGRP